MANDKGNVIGVMETTWVPAKYMIDGFAGKEFSEDGEDWFRKTTPAILGCYNYLFK